MKFEKWQIPSAPTDAIERLQAVGYPYLTAAVLAGRGITNAADAEAFLRHERELPYAPELLRDMDRAVTRIESALSAREKVAVFGDYDVDGITATCILTDYLTRRGGECVRYIPRRIEDGYGLSREPLRALREQGVSLIITVDCGITGVEETAYAAELGLDMVITDHHECKETLPDAAAVVNPHRSDCDYPFPYLAGCGVALKLVLALTEQSRRDEVFARYCPLAAIGTVADVMPMTGENRIIVSRGLEVIGHSDFIGLNALLKEANLDGDALTSVQIGFILAPRINAAGRMGQADLAADLLLTDDPARAELLAKKLCALNRERQEVEQAIFSEALSQIDALSAEHRHALVLSSDRWHQGVVGIVASRLSEKYSCPCFMIHLSDGVGKGSCRSWGGFNLFAALEQCADLLMGFGGHELAAGFTIQEENISAFRERMNRCAAEFCKGAAPVSSLTVDVAIARPSAVTLEEVTALNQLEPYGSGNARPVFCLCGATLESMQNVGQNKHLRLRLSKGGTRLDGIFFGVCAQSCGVTQNSRVDAAFYLQVNEFRGNRTVQLQLIDLRPSHTRSAKEDDALSLVTLCMQEKTLRPQQAVQLLPSREQCAAAWRFLLHTVPENGLRTSRAPFLRELSAALPGADAFLRGVFCMHLFAERGLLSCEVSGEELTIRLDRLRRGVTLEHSPYIIYLYQILGIENRGGLL